MFFVFRLAKDMYFALICHSGVKTDCIVQRLEKNDTIRASYKPHFPYTIQSAAKFPFQ